VTYATETGQEGHPVLAGVPSSFTFTADGHDAGPQVDFAEDPSVVLMHVSQGGPAVLARQFGSGKVVNFSFAPNHNRPDGDGQTLLNANVQRLYINAVRWVARPPALDTDGDGVPDNGDNCPDVANADQTDLNENGYGDVCEPVDTDNDGIPDASDNCPNLANPDQADENGNGIGNACEALKGQVITFKGPDDQIYGAPAFPLIATATSGETVTFTGTGQCTMTDGNLTVIEVGSCTVTAHQGGNDEYAPALDVTRTFNILKAPATIVLANASFTYDATARTVPAATLPSGLTGVSVSYSRAGTSVPEPTNAGSYDVTATLDNAHYTAPVAHGTLTITPATPTITWNSPLPITVGTALGAAQLNATATGVRGINLSSTFTYTPGNGTKLVAGTWPLSVTFTNPNYITTKKDVSITVTGSTITYPFSGFFRPVDNSAVNVVNAGSTIPLKFAVGGNLGQDILQPNSPISMGVPCGADLQGGTLSDRLARLKPHHGSRPEHGAGASNVVNGSSIASSTNGSLQYDGAQYTYLWKTSSDWTGCRQFVMTLKDGTEHVAIFSFGKEVVEVQPAAKPTSTKAPKPKKEKKEEKPKKNQKHTR
jgi:hypothetical protein